MMTIVPRPLGGYSRVGRLIQKKMTDRRLFWRGRVGVTSSGVAIRLGTEVGTLLLLTVLST